MGEPMRYDEPQGDHLGMVHAEDGQYVRQNDYAALQLRVEEMERVAVSLEKSVEQKHALLLHWKQRHAALEAENAELRRRAETEAMALFRDAWAAVREHSGQDSAEVLENMPGWGARMKAALQANGADKDSA